MIQHLFLARPTVARQRVPGLRLCRACYLAFIFSLHLVRNTKNIMNTITWAHGFGILLGLAAACTGFNVHAMMQAEYTAQPRSNRQLD